MTRNDFTEQIRSHIDYFRSYNLYKEYITLYSVLRIFVVSKSNIMLILPLFKYLKNDLTHCICLYNFSEMRFLNETIAISEDTLNENTFPLSEVIDIND